MSQIDKIVHTVLDHFPDVQAIYLFGSYGTEDEWPDSDIDIALLLPPKQTKDELRHALARCRLILEDCLGKDVDLSNVRHLSTVFQKEVVANGRLLYCADRYATDEFEMLTLSYYQKLNEERKEIVRAFIETGRAYSV